MTDEQLRELIRSEIRAAFDAARSYANRQAGHESDFTEKIAAYAVSGAMEAALVVVPQPEPVNPFEPKESARAWADEIRALIQQAQAAGQLVWIDGHSESGPRALYVGVSGVPPVFEEEDY